AWAARPCRTTRAGAPASVSTSSCATTFERRSAMNKSIRILALVLATTAGSAFAAAASNTLRAAGAQDQVPAALIAHAPAVAAAALTLDRTPVHLAHALDAAATLEPNPQPFRAASREFWSVVDADQLRAGMRLTTSAPGALIRLSPQDGTAAALDP